MTERVQVGGLQVAKVLFDFVNDDFSTIISMVVNDQIDLGISAMTDTKEREKEIDFVTYFSAGTSIVVQRGNPEGITDVKDLCGKKVAVERKVYPGYVLVEMQLDQETLHTVNGIQGVIKFVGKDRDPQALRPDEVNRLLGIADEAVEEAPKEEIPFLVGQAVAITEGPFSDFNGTVEDVMADKGKVRVSVSLFGRPTSVELDYLQLRAH